MIRGKAAMMTVEHTDYTGTSNTCHIPGLQSGFCIFGMQNIDLEGGSSVGGMVRWVISWEEEN